MALVPNLVQQVRTGFILQGTTFKAWCRTNRIDPGYAYHVAAGRTNGPKAQQLRQRIANAAKAGVAK